MKTSDIIDAYCRIRTIDNTIPDDVLDFMKSAAIEKLTSSPIDTDKLRKEFKLEWSDPYYLNVFDWLIANYKPQDKWISVEAKEGFIELDEKIVLTNINRMCEQSLPPDYFDKWESVKEMLIKNRKDLK